jgi:hypothetical protein
MHDAKGRPLTKGDTVLVPFRVRDTNAAPDYCNVTLESLRGRKPDGAKEVLCGNAAVTYRANPGDENDIAELTRE